MAGIFLVITSGLSVAPQLPLICVTPVIMTAVKVKDATGSSCQLKVKEVVPEVSTASLQGPKHGPPGGAKLCILMGSLMLLRTSRCMWGDCFPLSKGFQSPFNLQLCLYSV